ncbi:unnamed protein product [Rotaria magnacalcarata]|uniref:G-protein coupled receptors family 1 profile domain-containing protein n=2 Tax=Rotaria magnacalcarata TaxID=392030 RepID=A0A819VT66_9BILA|nr:unnamed protein product [Rotaria magnacalcarata]CAF1686852.1 unnamed protein product [Rotaria magnacalcarata]CAF1967677.1 unnamed protein product [Rotaria magnacalcarata]CAF2178950.1 unnamed protein product [Rotaria magnacalcarata]CAF2229996.1 unnamed protein product [Rotaria magnacalcarata]
MFGEIDYSLPNPHGLSSQISARFLPSPSLFDTSQKSYYSPNFFWSYYSIDLFNSNLNNMPLFTNNETTHLNTNLSTNISINSQQNSPSDDEAPDHLLYIIIPLYSIVFFIGTIGNILVILTVVTVKQMRNTTNALILHLAIANLSFVLMCIPHTIYLYVVYSYYFPKFLCKIANTLMYLSAYVSIYILVLMSIDRFLGVVFAVKSTKYRTERNAHLAVIVVWLFGIIFASPNMIYYDVLLVDSTKDIWICLFRDDSSLLNTTRRVTAYIFAVFGLIVPLIIIAILYGLIIKVLRENSTGKQVARGKKRVTKMISAVISSFVICWTPMQIYLLYTHHNRVTVLFAIVSQSLVYISACVNPILYAFLSEPFRKAFQQFLTCSKLISNHLFSHHANETNITGRNSAYRAIQCHSVSNISPMILNEDIKIKTKPIINHNYKMIDLSSAVIITTQTSETVKYDRLSSANTSTY